MYKKNNFFNSDKSKRYFKYKSYIICVCKTKW